MTKFSSCENLVTREELTQKLQNFDIFLFFRLSVLTFRTYWPVGTFHHSFQSQCVDIDELDPSNYRPISLLSIFNRIFGKLIYNRSKSFLDKHTIHCTIISMVSGKMLHTACTHWHCQRNPAQYWWRLFSCSIFIDLKNALDIVNLIAKTRTLRNPWSSKYLVFLLSKWSTSNYSILHLRILDRVLSLLCATRISPA